MDIYDLLITRRTIRQFKPEPVSRSILRKMVNAGRLAPSAANRQPLEFVVVDKKAVREQIFPCLKWAAYIAPDGDPKSGQEPAAYVVVLVNTDIRESGYERDVGAAVENMIIEAWSREIGSCWIISIDKGRVSTILKVPERYKVDSVLALGYPMEEPVIEDLKDSIKYWKDAKGRLHVPKRKLEDVIHFNSF